MFQNYLKIGWRNIIKGRLYSLVSIFGLSVGIAFTLLIAAYVWSELQVNDNLKNKQQQYILQSTWRDHNQGYALATLGPLAKELKEKYPHLVANYYRFDGISSNVSKGEKSFRESIQIGDSTLLSMYGFALLHGDSKTALQQPFTTVITKSVALKYFGETDVVGKTITIENFAGSKKDFLITGVLQPFSKNSVTQLADDYPGNFYVAVSNLQFFGRNMDWQNPFIVNYVELQKGVTPDKLRQPIELLIQQNAAPTIAANLTAYPVSLKEYYLSANNGLVKKMLYALSAIAVFILVMAIINFINMSISYSAARMREIGIRKVLGGIKKQLIFQFLIESTTVASMATLLAFFIYAFTADLFGSILAKSMPALSAFPFYFLLFPFLFALLVGFLAGIYPAFVLSSLPSVDSLKGKLSTINDKVFLRKFLIGVQFGIATIAFVGAVIISKQIRLFTGSDLGYNKNFIVSAQLPRDWTLKGVAKMERIRSAFASMSEVSDVTLSYEIPDGNNSGPAAVYKYGSDSTGAITAQALTTDENYLNVYEIPTKAGSFFTGQSVDSGKVVINETAVSALGWKKASDAIGQQIHISGDPTVFTVKGIAADFHFGSMQQKIAPIIFFNVRFAPIYRYFSFKLKSGSVAASIDALQKKWTSLMPGTPFEYKFMDDTLSNLYASELRLKKASYTATALAITIVLLGILGLISLSIQKRTKEVGIRKVLGSSVVGIIGLFLKEVLIVVLIGGVVACPIAYLIMESWLSDYVYRINMTTQPFLLSILFLSFITTLLIYFQTRKAATANPIKSLRTE